MNSQGKLLLAIYLKPMLPDYNKLVISVSVVKFVCRIVSLHLYFVIFISSLLLLLDMLGSISKLCFKDLFNEDDRVDGGTVMSMLVQYEQDRTKSVYLPSDLFLLQNTKVFYIDPLTARWDAYADFIDFDVFSKNKRDWDDTIEEITDQHTEWIQLHQERIKVIMNYSIGITWDIANCILQLSYSDGLGEPDLVKIDPRAIDSCFALSYKTQLVGCVNCCVYEDNICWDLKKVTNQDLQEHLESETHQYALNIEITEDLLIRSKIPKEHLL